MSTANAFNLSVHAVVWEENMLPQALLPTPALAQWLVWPECESPPGPMQGTGSVSEAF